MRMLLLVGHGSKASLANEQLKQLAALYPLSDQIQKVKVAYLEICPPDIGTGIDFCVQDGASKIIVMPYFLFDGVHVAKDIPEILDEARKRHPSVLIKMTKAIGVDKVMVGLIETRIETLP